MASKEQQTLVKSTSFLTKAFAIKPLTIATDLCTDGFIPQSVLDELVETNQPNYNKASRLVSCVSSQITSSPPRRVEGKFKAFIKVLEGHAWLSNIVDYVIDIYKEKGGSYERSPQTEASSASRVPNRPSQARYWTGLTCPVNEQTLMDELADVTGSKVHRLGIKLGVPHGKIKVFETNHPRDNERVKSEILKYWLDNAEECSWIVIANALRKIDKRNLADRIDGSADVVITEQSGGDEAAYKIRQGQQCVNTQSTHMQHDDSDEEQGLIPNEVINLTGPAEAPYNIRQRRQPAKPTPEQNNIENQEAIPQLVPIQPTKSTPKQDQSQATKDKHKNFLPVLMAFIFIIVILTLLYAYF